MNNLVKSLFAFLLLLSSTSSNAALIDTVTWNGTNYGLLSAGTWLDVQAEAVSLGGNLVTINSAAEQDFLFGLWGEDGTADFTFFALWIGYTDMVIDGDFQWISGESSSFTQFAVNEPNNDGGDEDYVWMQKWTGQLANGSTVTDGIAWNDASISYNLIGGVVEFTANVPSPSVSSLFFLMLCSIVIVRVKAK
ncbi:MAG: hypothetical protein HWE26_15910 [Alteromonadaceae bacterium]|nr:hypothetical protein [Alteromonadaceae bacterium]